MGQDAEVGARKRSRALVAIRWPERHLRESVRSNKREALRSAKSALLWTVVSLSCARVLASWRDRERTRRASGRPAPTTIAHRVHHFPLAEQNVSALSTITPRGFAIHAESGMLGHVESVRSYARWRRNNRHFLPIFSGFGKSAHCLDLAYRSPEHRMSDSNAGQNEETST